MPFASTGSVPNAGVGDARPRRANLRNVAGSAPAAMVEFSPTTTD